MYSSDKEKQVNSAVNECGQSQAAAPSHNYQLLIEIERTQKRTDELREYYVLSGKYPEIVRLLELHLKLR